MSVVKPGTFLQYIGLLLIAIGQSGQQAEDISVLEVTETGFVSFFILLFLSQTSQSNGFHAVQTSKCLLPLGGKSVGEN